MTDAENNMRNIELEVEVIGTPEEVWQAIATGPGISSWYVPHVVEEREGGSATASFGDGPEMQIPGRVTAWDPPRRIVFEGADDEPGLAFEWLIEARDAATCAVRLVNSGFGDGTEWDDQYDALEGGWRLFMINLQLHCRHFAGQHAVSMMPIGMWSVGRADGWAVLTAGLGIPGAPDVGSRLTLNGGVVHISGTVTAAGTTWLALLLDEPAPGTAIVTTENMGTATANSVWSYLYGPDAADIVARDEPRWQTWLDERAGGGSVTSG